MAKKNKDSNENTESQAETAPNTGDRYDATARVLHVHGLEIPLANVPAGNMDTLAVRTIRHILNNECAAIVTAAKAEAVKEWNKANGHAVDYVPTPEGLAEAFPDATRDAVLADARLEKVGVILNGELGVRMGGARLTGIDAFVRTVATETLRAIAAAKKAAMPKGDDLKAQLAALVASPKRGPIIRAEAERRMAQQAELANDE